MNRKSQRGVALVITLIMLSIVLIMAVLFLGISRRERASVTGSAEQGTANNAAEHGQTRALAEIIARVASQSNVLAYGMAVSTNFDNRAGIVPGSANPANVSYYSALSRQLMSGNDLNQMLVNLLYDPRPPVFVVTNTTTGATEFRYYLDLNRNGRFDTNGFQPVISANGQLTGLTNFYFGDPEWIGVLEHPDQPHSASNRFIARYAFLVVPAGRTLDINYIHNNARDPGKGPTFNIGFSRNQGVGSWEINLAAFFRDLNPNIWPGNPAGYHYTPGFGVPSASGSAFDDALSILTNRCLSNFRTLNTVGDLFPAGKIFQNDLIDEYGDDRPATGIHLEIEGGPTNPSINDNINNPWFGSENTNGFTRIDELFDTNKTSLPFVNHLRLSFLGQSTDNQTTIYRLMAQLGTDSLPANRGKLNLNYDNVNLATGQIDPSAVAGLTNWTPIRFFTNAADLMLRSQSSTILRSFGLITPNFTLSVTNIPIYPANLYSASVHRLLQLAANIQDATTNRYRLAVGTNSLYAPSVFRPLFGRRGTNIFISGFEEVTGTNTLRDPWADLNVPAQAFGVISESNPTNRVNVYGVPYVIGVKKGFPNFNEFLLRTSVQVTRRLEARKDSARDPLGVRYRQSYQFAVTNNLGLEAWNSYTQTFARPLTLILTNQTSMVISNANRPLTVPDPRRRLTIMDNMIIGSWQGWNPGDIAGSSFKVLMDTNVATFPEGAVLSDGTVRSAGTNSLSFEPFYGKFPVPEMRLYITNRIVYALVVQDVNNVPRLVDFVNLDRLTGGMDIMREVVGKTNAFGDVGLNPGSFWITNHLGGDPNAMTWGITNQIYVSTNDVLAKTDWKDYSDNPTSGLDKAKAVDNFRKLLGLRPIFDPSDTNLNYPAIVQVPFTPTRKLDQKLTWQANDPLVHYHIEDLTDPFSSSVTNIDVLTPRQDLDASNIGQLNDRRYKPWGGNPRKMGDGPLDFVLAVKDPLIGKSDDWDFPTNKFPNIGWLGRVHRGTPWQTVYLKSQIQKLEGETDGWIGWAGRADTHPTNDWSLLSLFTTAPNDAASRGLLSVNQTNIAAWSAVLSGVPVFTNHPNALQPLFIEPASPQLFQIVSNINATRLQMPNQVFPDLGSVLRSPALTVASPFLNTRVAPPQRFPVISDELYERIPQQILSLLKDDEPYVVIYSFGQALKPASDSIVTAPGTYRGLCTNYQVTAEVATKTSVRIEETRQSNNRPNIYKAVVEGYSILPAE